MKKAVFVLLALISLGLILAGSVNLPIKNWLGIKELAGVKVLSVPDGADVYINNEVVGKTPFEKNDLEVKDYLIKVKNEDNSWQGSVKLTPGTLSVVNRELVKDASSSAGEVLTLEKGAGVFINSWPNEANLAIDGKDTGKTPLLLQVNPGDHTFILSHDGFLERSIRASVPSGFKLNINVDLALSEASPDNGALPAVVATPTLVVKSTPTGFLRVRDKASLNGLEIAQVKPGDELTLLEEGPSWDKVRLSDGKEGYISTSYVDKKTPMP